MTASAVASARSSGAAWPAPWISVKSAAPGQARDIGVAVGARHHAIGRAPDHRGRHGGAVETAAQDAVVEIRRLESDEGAEAQHLVAPHLLLEVAAGAGIEAQSGGGVFGVEQELAQAGELHAALGLRVQKDVADGRARHEQSAGADQAEAPHPFGIAHGQFGGDPAADAVADQIETSQAQGVEDLEVMEDDILDAVAFRELVALRAAGMGGRDHPRRRAEPQVERLKFAGHPMHVGKAVEVDQRLALPAFKERHLAPAYLHHRIAHCAISALRSISGK